MLKHAKTVNIDMLAMIADHSQWVKQEVFMVNIRVVVMIRTIVNGV